MEHVHGELRTEHSITAETRLLANIATFARDSKNVKLLVQVLHMAQHLYGHLPPPLQEVVADEMNIIASDEPGVMSFYSFSARR